MNTFCIIVQIILAGFISSLVPQEKSDTVNMLETKEFYIKIHQVSNPLIVDVGEYKDYQKERIPGAVPAPTRDDLFSLTDTLDREQPIFIYCKYISRSITAYELLDKKNFSNIFVLKEGIIGWKKQGLETDNKHITRKKRKLF